MAETWGLQAVGDVAVHMKGARLQPKEAIKILGVLVDQKLSWEHHSAAMAAKARGVAHQVWRATNGLKRKHVVQIMHAMAHPFLDYAQPALTNPSSLTHNTMNKVYKLTARLAARTKKKKRNVMWHTTVAQFGVVTQDQTRGETVSGYSLQQHHV
eukprot:gene5537-biopygen11753